MTKYAKLCVEKYIGEELLLDFIDENEFDYYRRSINYYHEEQNGYIPSMLLFKNVRLWNLYEDNIIWIPMESLIANSTLYSEENYRYNEEKPYNILMTFDDCKWIEKQYRKGIALKNNDFKKEYTYNIKDKMPCEFIEPIERMDKQLIVEVVNVGQGNTNLIYDSSNLAIFDMGASRNFTKNELKKILRDLKTRFNDFRDSVLIISHWDLDHYNLLTVMDDDVLKNFYCVFVPEKVIKITSKNVIKKIHKNCKRINSISSPASTKRIIGMVPEISSKRYTLYKGNESASTNKSGLALTINGDSDVTILSADHTNIQIWKYIYNNIPNFNELNVIVPHHGGDCGKTKPTLSASKAGVAAISADVKIFGHPKASTINMYKNSGFTVKRTDDGGGKNIIINMK